ncbi:MAG: hypothetical protein WCV85_04495 [Patescibacteria group bacterium]
MEDTEIIKQLQAFFKVKKTEKDIFTATVPFQSKYRHHGKFTVYFLGGLLTLTACEFDSKNTKRSLIYSVNEVRQLKRTKPPFLISNQNWTKQSKLVCRWLKIRGTFMGMSASFQICLVQNRQATYILSVP